jgi:NAD(P)-dependent dehydrogenase (short-subunit alcohol dehydrogenase family)
MSKAVLITGASRGIGLATAMEFLENDPDTTELILVARKSSHADESFKDLQKLNKRGIKISKYGYDLSSEEDVEKFLEEIAKNHPNVSTMCGALRPLLQLKVLAKNHLSLEGVQSALSRLRHFEVRIPLLALVMQPPHCLLVAPTMLVVS